MTIERWMGAPSLILALSLAPGALAAQDVAQLAQEPDPVEQAVDELIGEYDAAMLAFREKYGEAKTDEERRKLSESYPDASEWFPRLLAIAEEHPLTDGAARGLVWIVQYGQGPNEQARIAFEYLTNDYLLHAAIAPLCDVLARRIEPGSEAALRTILTENASHDAQGAAAYSLAKFLMQKAEYAPIEEIRAAFSEQGGEIDPAAARKEAEALFDRVAAEYAEVSNAYGKLGELAAADLFELRNLQIGMVAPDILGEDIDGVPFKLSDYRGKVVLLDFWGNW